MPILLNYTHAIALTVTLLLETAGVALFAAGVGGRRRQLGRAMGVAILVNLVSHTLFWYTLPHLAANPTTKLYGYELLIVVAEAVVYAGVCNFSLLQALAMSFSVNALSFLAAGVVWLYVL